MEVFQLSSFIYLSIACFAAAFIDAIAGGGGMISLPAFMGAGIPPHIALGTNKVAASFGAFSSFIKFLKAGKIQVDLIKKVFIFTVLGAIAGVKTVLLIESKHLLPLALFLIVVLIVYTLYNKKMGFVNEFEGVTKESLIKGCAMAFGLGFYDGFFGPGAGSFLIFAFIKIFKFDFIHASGNAKALNFGSNIVSVVLFIYYGKVAYFYALPMALIMFLGAQAGSHFAIKKGSKFIKPVFVTVSFAVALKMASQFINFKSLLGMLG